MKRARQILFFITICLLVLLVGIIIYHKKPIDNNDVSITINNVYEGTEKDVDDFYYFTPAWRYFKSIPDKYKLVVVKGTLMNNSKYGLHSFSANEIKNDEVYIISECTDILPSYLVDNNSSSEIIIYILVNKNIPDNSITNVVSSNLNICCCADGKEKSEVLIDWDTWDRGRFSVS